MGNRDVGEQLDSCAAYSSRLEEAAQKVLADLVDYDQYSYPFDPYDVDYAVRTLNEALAGRDAT